MRIGMLAKLVSIICGLFFTLGLAAPADHEASAWQTLAQLEFPLDTRMAFKEARKTRLQRVEKIQHGHLWLSADGELAMQIDTPRSELRKIQGSTLSLTRGDKVRSTTLDPERGAHQLLLAVVQVLRGDTSSLQKSFQLTDETSKSLKQESAKQTPKEWVWSLKPKSPALQKQMKALILHGKGRRLLSLRKQRGASYQKITILASDDSADFSDQQK